jgi:hypothetical protein
MYPITCMNTPFFGEVVVILLFEVVGLFNLFALTANFKSVCLILMPGHGNQNSKRQRGQNSIVSCASSHVALTHACELLMGWWLADGC